MYLATLITAAPTPSVTVTAPNTQIVGQSLTLECSVTTVRGITSRVDIIWRGGGKMLRRTNNATPTILVNSLMYTDTYTISQLNKTDDGRKYRCQVVINTSLLMMATDSIPLGECMQQIISALLNSHVVTLHKNSV